MLGPISASGSFFDATLLNIILNQLLTPEAQQVVTDVESAYYLFLKCTAGEDLDLIKLYEPQVLEDIEAVLDSKVDMVEALMREYDFLHMAEESLMSIKKLHKLPPHLKPRALVK